MEPFSPLSTSDQLAEHLRKQIQRGTLKGSFPGIQQLVKMLGVNSMAAGIAVQQLEKEGLLIYQGDRKRRLIAEGSVRRKLSLRVGILYYDGTDGRRQDVLAIKQELMSLGHSVFACPKSMVELGFNVERTARLIESLDADAWVISGGPRQILQWFERQEWPAFALHGRLMEVKLASASVRKTPVISEVVDKLVGWGHRRIVMLAREERRKPELGFVERSFIGDLERHGVQTGPYNIPDWKDTPTGLENGIEMLFHITPPTAMIVGDSTLFHATQLHLAALGVMAPRDISLVCLDFQESFHWTKPLVSHIQWDHRPAVRRVARWINHVSRGKSDTKRTYIKARLVEGGTMGPARDGR